ncbi:MAG: ABC transporter substrate-binding protein [Mycobacteriales bacterium]
MRTPTPRFVAGITLLMLASAACGLSSGATQSLEQAAARGGGAAALGAGTGTGGLGSSGGGSTTGSSGVTGSATGTGGSATGAGSTSTGTGGTTGTNPGSGPSTGTGPTSTTCCVNTGGGTQPGQPSYERIGITPSTIYLGVHAPETGAAPIPLQAFATGAKLFWENHTIFGRKVVMQFMDDQYNPSVARSVCEQLSRQDFLVIGGAGTDQIQACATDPVLAQSHTPYLSAGVTTNGLTSLFNYFAITSTYASQSPAVYTMANQLFASQAKGKWAIMTEATPNFNDATTSMEKVLAAHGVSYTVIRTPKYYSQSDANTAVSAAKQFGATTVYLDVDPNFWIDIVQAAQEQLYAPAWVGPGITNGENLVVGPICGEQPQVHAAFLSPYPGLDRQPPGFSAENNPAPDSPASERDIEMLIYGLSEVVYREILAVGSIANLTRDNFIASLPHFSATYNINNGPLTVMPGVNFAGGHFGGTGMWELELSCSATEYVTEGELPT